MRVTRFYADGFKNLQAVEMTPDEHLNIILGENAQGKTNLLDALWLMTGCRNFHGARESHAIGFSREYFRCEVNFHDGERERAAAYGYRRLGGERSITLGGVPAKPGDLFEAFHAVAFSPSDGELVSGPPERRRAFMDLCACQLRREGLAHVGRFRKILAQHAAALKSGVSLEAVTIWEEPLAREGAWLSCLRSAMVQSLSPLCGELYQIITGGRETLCVTYRSAIYPHAMRLPSVPNEEMIAQYKDVLASSRAEDRQKGFTLHGAQRDELLLTIDGRSVRDYASQGQRKSAALVLKLAQARLYHQKTGRTPIILLDDVMGELDARRQALLYEMVSQMQVFLTLCHPAAIGTGGRVFYMRAGELSESPAPL